jgi:hypothetical protein
MVIKGYQFDNLNCLFASCTTAVPFAIQTAKFIITLNIFESVDAILTIGSIASKVVCLCLVVLEVR